MQRKILTQFSRKVVICHPSFIVTFGRKGISKLFDKRQNSSGSKMVEELTDDQINQFKKVFKKFDKDASGYIPMKTVGTVMRLLGQNPTELELENYVHEVDPQGSGFVDFPTFVGLMAGKLRDPFATSSDEMIEAFRVFDTERTGMISADYLREILSTLGEKLGDQEIDELVRVSQLADKDADGNINYEALVNLIFSNAKIK